MRIGPRGDEGRHDTLDYDYEAKDTPDTTYLAR
jgi:hypothetical protein